jgi:hypothetical protein
MSGGRGRRLAQRFGHRNFFLLAPKVAVMKTWLPIAWCLLVISQAFAEQPAKDFAGKELDDETGFVSLFDGETTTGWEGPMEWFRIEDRAVVGGTLKKAIPHNYFLCTTKNYGDFELRLDVKVVGENANAGVQFRTKRIEGSSEVSGYQADVGGVGKRSVWGSLYDESRRRKFLVEADAEVIRSIVKPNDWNHYRIRCVGPKVELFLNGVQTVAFTEEDDSIERDGVIALQIHSGPPTEAWYRNIRIKAL